MGRVGMRKLAVMARSATIIRATLMSVAGAGAAYFMFSGYINPIVAGWPMTVDAAADEVIGWLSEEQKAEIRATARDDLVQYHLGLGMAIRNEFGLWSGNWPLFQSACETPCHPDGASMVIIERAWEKLREQRGVVTAPVPRSSTGPAGIDASNRRATIP